MARTTSENKRRAPGVFNNPYRAPPTTPFVYNPQATFFLPGPTLPEPSPHDSLIRIKLALSARHPGSLPTIRQDTLGLYAHWNAHANHTSPYIHPDTYDIFMPNSSLHDLDTAVAFMVFRCIPIVVREFWGWQVAERWMDVTSLYLSLVHRATGRYPETRIQVRDARMLREIVWWFRMFPVFMERYTLVLQFICSRDFYCPSGRELEVVQGWE